LNFGAKYARLTYTVFSKSDIHNAKIVIGKFNAMTDWKIPFLHRYSNLPFYFTLLVAGIFLALSAGVCSAFVSIKLTGRKELYVQKRGATNMMKRETNCHLCGLVTGDVKSATNVSMRKNEGCRIWNLGLRLELLGLELLFIFQLPVQKCKSIDDKEREKGKIIIDLAPSWYYLRDRYYFRA